MREASNAALVTIVASLHCVLYVTFSDTPVLLGWAFINIPVDGKNSKSRVAWKRRHDVWLGFVESLVSSLKRACGVALGPAKYSTPKSERRGRRRVTVLICSPHPDDEALVGGFALRALRECNARVVNCAITLGADPMRKKGRLNELRASCAVLGFELKIPGWPRKLGLDVDPQGAKSSRQL